MAFSAQDAAHGRVLVVGAGVVGLTCALRLAQSGRKVAVLADASAQESVSGVAGGIWFPHQSEASERAARLLAESFAEFVRLAHREPASGVDLVPGTWVGRGPEADASWADALFAAGWDEPVVELAAHERPDGATRVLRATLPIVDMPTYLPWLRARCEEAGVGFVSASVDSIEAAVVAARGTVRDGAGLDQEGAAVVVAAGGRSGALLGDDASEYPVRGQIVRVAQGEGSARVAEWYIDDFHPDGEIYTIPRRRDVVVGGTDDVGATDTTFSAQTQDAILARAVRARPELSGLPVVGGAVGLRPARPTLRLERVEGHGIPVVAAYGHGGAGVTLSWGTADEVVALLG